MSPHQIIDEVIDPLLHKIRRTSDMVSIHPSFDLKSRHQLTAQLALTSTTLTMYRNQINRGDVPNDETYIRTIEDASAMVNEVDYFLQHLSKDLSKDNIDLEQRI